MAITIEKILSKQKSRDGFLKKFILTDGIEKRICRLSGLVDDDATDNQTILSRSDELWSIHSEDKLNDIEERIYSKDIDRIKNEASSSNSVPALRAQVLEIIDLVKALTEKVS